MFGKDMTLASHTALDKRKAEVWSHNDSSLGVHRVHSRPSGSARRKRKTAYENVQSRQGNAMASLLVYPFEHKCETGEWAQVHAHPPYKVGENTPATVVCRRRKIRCPCWFDAECRKVFDDDEDVNTHLKQHFSKRRNDGQKVLCGHLGCEYSTERREHLVGHIKFNHLQDVMHVLCATSTSVIGTRRPTENQVLGQPSFPQAHREPLAACTRTPNVQEPSGRNLSIVLNAVPQPL
ncbi:hypothetical protein BKA93DRAFT_596213 [Sparassis latifolia]